MFPSRASLLSGHLLVFILFLGMWCSLLAQRAIFTTAFGAGYWCCRISVRFLVSNRLFFENLATIYTYILCMDQNLKYLLGRKKLRSTYSVLIYFVFSSKLSSSSFCSILEYDRDTHVTIAHWPRKDFHSSPFKNNHEWSFCLANNLPGCSHRLAIDRVTAWHQSVVKLFNDQWDEVGKHLYLHERRERLSLKLQSLKAPQKESDVSEQLPYSIEEQERLIWIV